MATTQPWTFAGEPPAEASAANVTTLIEGSTFCISDTAGDVLPARPQGLFVRDTRVLSQWRLLINDLSLESLAVEHQYPFAGTFVCRLPPAPGTADSSVLVLRRRYVGEGMREDITIRNTALAPLQCLVTLDAGADFADLFEVKDGRVRNVNATAAVPTGTALVFTSHRMSSERSVLVHADGEPQLGSNRMTWPVELGGRASWTTSIEVVPTIDGHPLALRHPRGSPVEEAAPARRLQDWRGRSPAVRTADPVLAAALGRSIEDLGALRIYDPDYPERPVVAAGVPWFMALFGRDSLLTSWMLMPLDTSLAEGTLLTLADHQGARFDPDSEEEPGRILHEIRFGPASEFATNGRSVYYGTVDATPLFVMLVGELRRWGGSEHTIRRLLPHVDRALDWITLHGDADGDGFVEYSRKTERGLVNQGWKDSWDGVNFADGRIAEAPIALAEVQGYCYAAFMSRSRLAAEDGDDRAEKAWAHRAERLKESFNAKFWLPDVGWYAVGLDRDKKPIDALTSNIGHCLWTGIVDDDKAQSVADHLLSAEMFSGWGIRTLGCSMGAYNPLSYHNGSVWPHDNAICAAGLMRYGFVEHAQRVITALLDASERVNHRLPELFCGLDRSEFRAPVAYPSACSPQAWAAATPISFLRTMLRLDPAHDSGELVCAPEVPSAYLPLQVSGMRLGASELTIDVSPDGWQIQGFGDTGMNVTAPRRVDSDNQRDEHDGHR